MELAGSTQEEESEEETEFQHVQDDPKEETIQTSSEFRPLTSNEIRGHEDVFRLLEEINDLNVLVRIGQLGFDLNKVVAKKEEICKFLQADEAKIRISKTLEKANEAKKRAARAFAQSLQDLTEAAQALEEE